jgi:RHS repeat-associated protein
MWLSSREAGHGLTSGARALAARLRGLVHGPVRRLVRRRVKTTTAVISAVVLVMALAVAVAVVTSPSPPGPPVQQWGTAAGRSHRAPPAVATVVDGRVVREDLPQGASARAALAATALREVRAPKGAVPPSSTPPRLKLGVAAKPRDMGDVLPAQPAPAAPGFSARSSKVVEGQTSADRLVYQNADGTKTAQFFGGPVNYRLPDGSWARINTALVPAGSPGAPPPLLPTAEPSPLVSPSAQASPPAQASPRRAARGAPSSALPSPSASPSPSPSASPSGPSSPSPSSPPPPGGWREAAAAQPETFAAYADGSPLLVVPLGGSRSVGLSVADAARAPGSASGGAVTYPGARPDAALRLVAGVSTADVQVVLDSASAPRTWVFPLRLEGLSARTGPGGTIEFTSASGKVVAFMPPGQMSDSDINPHSGDGAQSDGVSYALTTAGGRPAVRMTLDAAWLDSPSRVFPVTVDPSVEPFYSGGTTYVESGEPGNNSSDVEIKAGTWDGGTNVARSLLNFSSVATTLQYDTVLGAQLGLFNTWSYSCSARPVDVYPVTSSWSTGSDAPTTYPGPSIGPEIGSKSFATGYVPPDMPSSSSSCPAAWEGIPLNEAGTQLINGWTHGTTPDDGLALAASPTDSYGWKKFASDSSTDGDPFLSVTYTEYGASYKLASSQPVTQVWPDQNGQIAITVTNTGSQTWTPPTSSSSGSYELSYEAYNAQGQLVANAPVFTPMPKNVGPEQSVTLDATVDALKVGSYTIDFDMYKNAPGTSSSPAVSFLSQGIAPFAIALNVPQPPPIVTGVYPPTGYLSPTVNPELSTTASSTNGTAITYQFSLACEPLPGTTCPASTINSPSLTVPYWTPTTALTWNEPYQWTVTATNNGVPTTTGPVMITPEVPQPAITSGLGGASGQAFDPQSGNFTTGATDASVAVAGPPLRIDRTYNSLDPRTSGAFGAGWSSVLDAAVIPDNDGSGNVVVALPDGQQIRFGYNVYTGTYAAPPGSPDVLVHNSDGTWTLMDSSGDQYEFTSGGTIEQITDAQGLSQDFTVNSSGEVTAITDAASGRSLTLAWATPPGAAHPHVSSVTTSSPASGQAGLTWSYAYSGDELTQVCDPSGDCTSYTYGSGSNYRSAVLDAGPRNYWQLGDASGSASAADEVDVNLGTTDGTYSGVTLGAPGPLAGSSETAASFNGTSSYVSLPTNVVSDQSYVSIGLWFKAASSTASGVLFSYSADPITNSSGNSAAHVPALYVGGNGELYGELWNGSADPMHSSVSVDDGNWHYAVLTGSATSQSLWLDGTLVGTMSGQITPDGLTSNTVGAGFWEDWPEDYATQGPALVNTPVGYFDGSIGQVAVYPHPLGQPAIASQYALAQTASPELTQVTLPSGRVYQQASYDNTQDRVASYTDPNGGQWQISRPLTTGYKPSSDSLEEATRSVTVTTPAGYDQVYGYDAVNGGRLISFTPGNGDAPETFGYDAAGFLNQIQDSDGDLITLTNDIHGNVLSRTWYSTEPGSSAGTRAGPEASTASVVYTSYYTYYYDASNPLDPRNNELTGVADARSASPTDTTYLTSYAYNAAGELTGSTTPATSDFPSGRTTSYAYSTSSTSAYGGGTTPPGLLLSSTTPGGAVTRYAYYSDGDLAQVTQPAGASTVYTYDGLGRALTATTTSDTYPGGLTTSYTWTPDNQPLTVTYPGVMNAVTGVTHTLQDSYAYDADGNLLSLTQSDLTGGDAARVTSYTYNDHGEVASVTQPGGATSGSGTQSQGASSPNPAGATTGYSYNDSGLVATMTDPDGNEYDYTYNEYGELTQTTLTVNSTNESVPGGGSSQVLDSYAYDPAGLLAAVTDAMGRITDYQYNGDDELVQAIEAPSSGGTGRMTTYSYDPAGNLTETDVSSDPVTTADQSITEYTYDAADRLDSMVTGAVPSGGTGAGDPDRTTSYTYNADNEVTSQTVTGVNGPATTDYGYNGADEMTSRSVVNGSVDDTTTWAYDELGQPVSMTAPDGNASGATAAGYTTNYTYDQAGNLASVTGPPVATSSYTAQTPATTRPVTTYGYDTFGDQTQAQDPDGNLTATGYDGDGRVISVTQPSYTPPGSSTPITATTKYGYDEDGNLTSVTDPEGNTTSYGYDALGDVASVTDPQLTGQSAPGVWSFTYDPDGEELSATSPTGAETQATYDDFGDQATATQDIRSSSGTAYDTTSYTYDYLGDRLTATTPDGVVTTDGYDSLGELTSTTNGAGDTTSYDYNYAGQLAEVINPDGSSADYGYNGTGELASVTDYGASAEEGELPPVLATQSYTYDPSGNQVSATDGDGHTTSYGYNAAGELTSQVQPVSSSASDTTSYGYDPAGNQTSVTDPNGNTTWTTYSAWDLPESVIEPATATAATAADRTWTTAYDADGQPATVTQPGGITLSYGYDQMGDLTSESGSGGSAPTTAQSFGYDLDGNLTSATAPGGTDAFTYNDAGQLTGTSGPSGTASFGYNADGLMTSRTDAAGTTSYTYDDADRLASVADPLTGATLSYGYNADSLPATVSYAENGTAGPTESLGYDGLQRLSSDTLTSPSGATIASASYGYDADSNLTSQTTTGYAGAASTTYGYNQADELTSATTGGTTTSYGYDADGDLTQAGATSYSYNAQDQPVSSATSAGTTSYSYTLSGALASVTPPSGTAQDYTSNAYGQTVTAPGGIGYAYDALGRLATRTTGSGTTDFAYSGTSDTVASDGTTSYTYDPAGNPIAEQPDGGTAEAALTDVHGDLTGLFSPASSTTSLAASSAYSPYGAVTATAGTMPALGYQDQYTDPATGDTDMSARWYSPATSTFTSSDTTATGMPDPAAISGTPYGYVDGDPLTNDDLSGHCGGWVSYLCRIASAQVGADVFAWEMSRNIAEGVDVALFCGAWGPEAFAFCAMAAVIIEFALNDVPDLEEAQHADQSFYNWLSGLTQPGGEGGAYDEGGDYDTCPFCQPTLNMPWLYGYDELYLSLSLSNFGYYEPPPPPPQDCYAGPNPTCHPPAPPKSLLDAEVITAHPSNITSLKEVPRADTIIEPTPTEQQLLSALHLQTAGITSSLNENGELAAGQEASGSTGQAQAPFTTIGVPAAPQAPVPSSASPVTVSLPLTTPAAPIPASPVPGIGIPGITGGANVGVPIPEVRESLAAANAPGVTGDVAAGPGSSAGPWLSMPQVSARTLMALLSMHTAADVRNAADRVQGPGGAGDGTQRCVVKPEGTTSCPGRG